MAISSYLESLPLNEIAKYSGGPPKNGVIFAGYPRQHPAEKNKLILVYDPLGDNPAVMEFLLDDILFVEELHSVVTESGERVPLVKLWVRKGARGVVLEPFEVDEPVKFIQKTEEFRRTFLKRRSGDGNGAGKDDGL
jgi:hypothetical protein